MSKLQQLVKKSQNSKFYNWILNFVLARNIPFNAPHHFRITQIEPGNVTIELPYRRSNFNHVKGIHACALATLCEYTVGLSLITLISEKEYRIILKSIKIDYHYQARMDVIAKFKLPDIFLKESVELPLQNSDAIFHEFEIDVFDTDQNHICTGTINWQIKNWTNVKTAV